MDLFHTITQLLSYAFVSCTAKLLSDQHIAPVGKKKLTYRPATFESIYRFEFTYCVAVSQSV